MFALPTKWNSVSAEIRNPIPKQTGNQTLAETAYEQFRHCSSLGLASSVYMPRETKDFEALNI
jgi:hypothetical protein